MPSSSGVTGLRADYNRRLEASFSSVGTPVVSVSLVERALLQMGLVVSEERLISCINEVHDYCFACVFLYVFEVCGKEQADLSAVGLAALQQHMPIDLFPFLLLRDQPDEQPSYKKASPPPAQSVAASLVPPTIRSLFIRLQPSVVGSGQMEAARFSRPLTCAEYAMVVRCVVDSVDAEFNSFDAKEYVCSGPEGDYALGNVFEGICAALEGDLFAEGDAGDGEEAIKTEGAAFSGAELIKFLKKFSIDVSEQGTLRSASTLSGSHPEPALSPFRRKSSFTDIASLLTRRKSLASLKRLSVSSPTTEPPDELEASPSSSWSRLRSTAPVTSGPPKLSQMQGADLTRMLVGTLLGKEVLQQEGVYRGRDRLKQVTLQRIDDVRAQAASREMVAQLPDAPPAVGPGSPTADVPQPKPSTLRKKLSASLLSRSGMPDPDRPRLTRASILGQLPSEIRPSDVAGNGPAFPAMSPQHSMRLPNSKSFLTAITLLTRAGSSARLKRQPSMGGGGSGPQPVAAPVVPRVPTPRGVVDYLAGEDYQERCRDAVVDARAARDDAFLLDSYLTLEPYHPFADRFNDPPEEGSDSPTRTHKRAEDEFRSLGVLPPTAPGDVFQDTPIGEISRCGLDELERKVEKMFEMDTKAEALARKRDVDKLLHTSERVRSSLKSREAASTQSRKERLEWVGDVNTMDDRVGVSGKSTLWAKLRYGVYAHPLGMDADSPLKQEQLPALQDSDAKRSPTTEDAPASRPAPMTHWMVQQVHRGRTFLSSEVPVDPEEYRKRSNYLLDLQQRKAVQASRAHTPSTRSHHHVSSTPTCIRYSAEATPLRLPTANRSSGRPQTSNSSMFGMVSPTPLPTLTEDEEGAIDQEVSAMLATSQSPSPSRRGLGSRGPTARALVPDDVVHVAHHKARAMGINLIPPEEDTDQLPRGDGKKKKTNSQASLAARKLVKKKKLDKKREEEALLVEWALRRRRDGFKA